MIILMVIGGVSLLAGFAGVIFWGNLPTVSSSYSDSYSVSALGHRAFVDLLEEAGYRVLRSRSRSDQKAGEDAVLVLIEPRATREEIESMLGSVTRALVVLPKWTGIEDREHPGWIVDAELVAKSDVDVVIQGLGIQGGVVRESPRRWDFSRFKRPPVVASPPQTLRSINVDDFISADGAVMLGSLQSQPLHWVLTDPDIVANHGVSDNAELILAMFARLAPDGQVIIVDETLHGHEVPLNIWGELGRFPLVLVLISAALMFGFWAWSGMRRFGSPTRSEYQLADGMNVLIENTAQLLMVGGHSGSVLRRYFEHVLADVAHFYRLSPELSRKERSARLKHMSSSRIDLEELQQEISVAGTRTDQYETRVLHTARRIRQWREETMNGTH
jgi:hypothetical protein